MPKTYIQYLEQYFDNALKHEFCFNASIPKYSQQEDNTSYTFDENTLEEVNDRLWSKTPTVSDLIIAFKMNLGPTFEEIANSVNIVPNFKKYSINDIQLEFFARTNFSGNNNSNRINRFNSNLNNRWHSFVNYFRKRGYSADSSVLSSKNFNWIEKLNVFRIYDISTFMKIIELVVSEMIDETAIDTFFKVFNYNDNISRFNRMAKEFLYRTIGNENFYSHLDDFIDRFEKEILKDVDIKEKKIITNGSGKDPLLFWPFVNWSDKSSFENWSSHHSSEYDEDLVSSYSGNCIIVEYTTKKKFDSDSKSALAKMGNNFISLNELKFNSKEEWLEFFNNEFEMPYMSIDKEDDEEVMNKRIPSFIVCKGTTDPKYGYEVYKPCKNGCNKMVLVIPISWQGVCFNPNCIANFLPNMQ